MVTLNLQTIGTLARNGLDWSKDLTKTGFWDTFSSGTRTFADATAPDGTLTATQLVASTSTFSVTQNVGEAAFGDTAAFIVASIYIKRDDADESDFQLLANSTTATSTRIFVDWTTTTPTVTSSSSGSGDHFYHMRPAGSDGWYRLVVRISWAGVAELSATTFEVEVRPDTSGGNGGVWTWGAQLEESDAYESPIQHTTNVGTWDGDRSDIQAWINNTGGDLVGGDRREIGMLLPGRHVVTTSLNIASTTSDATRYRHLTTIGGADDEASYPEFDEYGHRYDPSTGLGAIVEFQWDNTGDEDAFDISDPYFRMSNFGIECVETQQGVTGGDKRAIAISASNVVLSHLFVRVAEGKSDSGLDPFFLHIEVGDDTGPTFREDVVIRECILVGSREMRGSHIGIKFATYSRGGEVYGNIIAGISGGVTPRGFWAIPAIQGSPSGTDNVKLRNNIIVDVERPDNGVGTCVSGVLYSDDSDPAAVVKGFSNNITSDNSIRAVNFTGDGSFDDPDIEPGNGGGHEGTIGHMPGAQWGISSSSLFVNHEGDDFHASPFSPALDAGYDLTTEYEDATKGPGTANDFDDAARSTSFDVGPYTSFREKQANKPTVITSAIGSQEGTGRDFSTIQQWIDHIPTKLASANEVWVGELYADADFEPLDTITFTRHTATRVCYVHLKAAALNRYNPPTGKGAKVVGGGYATPSASLVYVRMDHVRIEGMALDQDTTTNVAERAITWAGHDGRLDSVFSTFDGGTNANNLSIELFGSRVVVANCIFRGSDTENQGPPILMRIEECDQPRVINSIFHRARGNAAVRGCINTHTNTRRALLANVIAFGTGGGNRCTYTEAFNNLTGWTEEHTGAVWENSATAPDGTMTADRLNDNDAGQKYNRYQNFTGLVDGQLYTWSAHALEGSASVAEVWVTHYSAGGKNVVASYDWDTEELTVSVNGGATGYGAVEVLADGWIRLEVTILFDGASTGLRGAVFGDGESAASDGTTWWWGAQFERGAAASAYQANATAAPSANYVDYVDTSGAGLAAIMSNCSSGDTTALGPDQETMIDVASYFTNAEEFDYRIKPDSPGLYSGLNVLLFAPTDFDGDARTAPMSRGAYEGFFSAPLVPAAPSSASMCLVKCTEITRSDGVAIRVCSNSEPVLYNGHTYDPEGGMALSALRAEAGLRPTTINASGAISSSKITAEALAAGRYDGALVREFTVDPRFPFAQARKERRYRIGAVSHTDAAWEATMQGALSKLERKTGELVTLECTYDLGDDRCGYDLQEHTQTDCRVGIIVNERQFTINSDDIDGSLADDFFGNGKLRFFTGAAAGLGFRIKEYVQSTRGIILTTKVPIEFAVGDRCIITPGCRHRYTEDCVGKFNRGKFFGGAEALPGTDRTLETPQR